MIYTTRVRKTNQAWQEISFHPVQNIMNDPAGYLSRLPDKHHVLINYLLEAENKKYKNIYPNQTTLGSVMGCGRQRANEIIGELQELGIIATNYRHMRSCLYKTTPFLKTPFMAQKLCHIFPALKKLLLLLAIPCFGNGVDTEATQGILKNYNVYSTQNIFKKMGLNQNAFAKKVHKYCPLPQCLVRQPLSLEQKCTLAAYPEWLIDQALFKITDMSRIKNLGGYLYDYCRKYCNNPNWRWSSELKELYKNEPDYKNPPLFVEENDVDDVYYPTRPAYKRTYKEDKKIVPVEPRRSPEGMSPMVKTERPAARLYSYTELNALLDRLSSLGEIGKIGARAIVERQTELLSQLSPEEQAAWAEQAIH